MPIPANLPVKYIVIPLMPDGANIWDTPRPKSQGANLRRAVAVGTPLQAYDIFTFGGVPYAMLVPQDPNKSEWVRVSEAGGTPKYIEKVELPKTAESRLVEAINDLANAIRQIKA